MTYAKFLSILARCAGAFALTAAAWTAEMHFTLTSTTSGTAPFTLGYAFCHGDIPAGTYPTTDLADAQVTVKNSWPDGSAKFAIVAGHAPLVAGVPLVVSLVASATPPSGTALTTTDLKSYGATAVISCGAYGSASWAAADWDSPFQSWIAGPKMSSWIFRKAVGSDPTLVAWLEVRLFADGAVEVLPWIENGYITVANPVNKAAVYDFTLGGIQRFSAAIDLPARTRTPLLSGPALSYWLGTDPAVSAQHDVDYLQSTELVPSYRAVVADDSALVHGLVATFDPLQQGNFDYSLDTMGSTGYASPIGLLPQHDVLYLVAHAPTIGAAVQRNGYSAGRYAIHYRDEVTNRPLRFSAHPTTSTNYSSTGDYPTVAPGTAAPQWDVAHSPSVGYMAYLLSGRYYFMEEVQFAATGNYLFSTDGVRHGADGWFEPYTGAVQVRQCAWAFRTLMQALAVTADSDTDMQGEFRASVESNIARYYARYVATTNNPMGFIESNFDYSTNYGSIPRAAATGYMAGIWMQDFFTGAYGWALAMQLPISSTAQTQLTAFFQWEAQSIVGRLGPDDTGTNYWYINAAPYGIAVSANHTPDFATGTGPWLASWHDVYTATKAVADTGQLFAFGSTQGVLADISESGANSMWGNLQPAIAYAVRHGVPGASAAYQRMISASNWGDLATQFNAVPVWSVKPAASPGATPAWLAGAALNQLIEIPGTVLAGSPGAPGQDPRDPYAPVNRGIRAYSGMAIREDTSEIIVAASGGHSDSADNGVRSIALNVDAPTWALRKAPSPAEQVVADQPYYADGQPSSRHVYWSINWIPSRNRLMLHSSRFVYGVGVTFRDSNGFDLATNTWDADNTWSDAAPALPVCREVDSSDCWAIGNDGTLYKWTAASDTWTLKGTFDSSFPFSPPMVHDPARHQLFSLAWGNGQANGSGLVAYVVTNDGATRSPITFNPSAAFTQWQADTPYYAAMEYDPEHGCYLFYSAQEGATQRMYVITPNAGTVWDMSLLPLAAGSVTPVQANGLMSRMRYVPALKGFVIFSDATTNLYFIRTGTINAPSQVAAPTISPDGGTFTSSIAVTLACTTNGAAIHYTTDGSMPTAASPTYSAALTITATTTIKAIATFSGMTDSPVASATFTNSTTAGVVATPTISPNGGTFASSVTVTLACATAGAAIHYTIDGSTPTAASPTYSVALTISATTTIKVIASHRDMTDSAVASAAFTADSVTIPGSGGSESNGSSGRCGIGSSIAALAGALLMALRLFQRGIARPSGRTTP